MGSIKTNSLGSIFYGWLEQPEVRHYFNFQHTGFVQSLEFLKFPTSFPVLEKFWKSGKKSLSFFFFFQIYIKCFISEIFLHFGQILLNLAYTFAAHHGNKNNWTLKHHVTWRPPAHSNPNSDMWVRKTFFVSLVPQPAENNTFSSPGDAFGSEFFREKFQGPDTEFSLVFFADDEFYSYVACVFFFSLALAERNCEILAWVFKSWWQTWRSKFSLHLSSIGKLRRRKDEVFQLMQENKINPTAFYQP